MLGIDLYYKNTILFQHASLNSINILISMEGVYIKNTYKRDNYLQNYYGFTWILFFLNEVNVVAFFA